MVLSKNTLQNLFFFILTICVSFNASNNDLLVQLSSINFIILFLLCLKNNQISEAIKVNYKDNKNFFIFFFIYIIYLIIQIIPLPLSWVEAIAPNNYEIYKSIRVDKELWSLSIDPSNSYFKLLNWINFFIIFLIFPILFNRSKYLMKFLFFLCCLGFIHSIFATYWMLIGNPSDFLIEKMHYLNSSTGLYVNRSVFATFLLLSAFSGLYYIVVYFHKNEINNFTFLDQVNSKIIYIRIFIIFLSIGILTTWSRAVNFSYILILISFLFYSKIHFKKYINPLSSIIIFIFIFDIIILGMFFGNTKLVARYSEVSNIDGYILNEAKRLSLHKFGFNQFKDFWLFGYGSGGFGQVYKLFYIVPESSKIVAQHAHNNILEFIGGVGIIGSLIFISFFSFYYKRLINKIDEKKRLARLILFSLLIIILFIQGLVDFSMHITGISILFVTILSLGFIESKKKISS
jgi:O-antigen ligase